MNNNACIGQGQINMKSRYFPSAAIEVTFVNKKLLKLNNNNRGYKLNGYNHINARQYGDCQLID